MIAVVLAAVLGSVLALVSDQVLATINGIELLGIVYLAIAVSKLRERIAHMEGRYERQQEDERLL